MKPTYLGYVIKLESDYINVYGLRGKGREERVSWSGLPDWLRARIKALGLKLHVCHRYRVSDIPIPNKNLQRTLEKGMVVPGKLGSIDSLLEENRR
ncbi:hypothetical protein DRN76_02360 [Methanosarcinales archaeon]|nr:MAG: hypothetical protein DRN76_02360 [Methanosarcinales archaeon]